MNCELNDQDCTDSSCLYDGTCIDGINNYTCDCKPGYTGSNCQIEINECDSNPCQNGGTCMDHFGAYACHFGLGFTGVNCEDNVNWCSPTNNPCFNGATCNMGGHLYECTCVPGWVGKLCDVPQVSCEVAAFNKNVSRSNLCLNEGTCIDAANSHSCLCQEGYTGSYCELDIDECASAPCINGGTCTDSVNSYTCSCVPGFQGPQCELNINECASNPCQNGGQCHDMVNGYTCSCPAGTQGADCSVNLDDCYAGACYHGGTCMDQVGTYTCDCPHGFVGQHCEGDVNECLSNPCDAYGSQDCVQLVNDYQCVCKMGFTGKNCDLEMPMCQLNTCQNGGTCTPTDQGYSCECQDGFGGHHCETPLAPCTSNPCQNEGTCEDITRNSYICICPSGVDGDNCENDYNECASSPCTHRGTCIDEHGRYLCDCPPSWTGHNCHIFDPTFAGGIGTDPPAPLPETTTTTTSEVNIIQTTTMAPQCSSDCLRRKGNGQCDDHCNIYVCDWDGEDCSFNQDPWENCPAASTECWNHFGNGICDRACNTKECLYDGFDCEDQLPQDCPSNSYCVEHYADGTCDETCNDVACLYDGMDCLSTPEYATGVLVVVVLIPYEVMLTPNTSNTFLQDMSKLLRTITVFARTIDNDNKIEPWNNGGAGGVPVKSKRDAEHVLVMDSRKRLSLTKREVLEVNAIGSEVYLLLDNSICNKERPDSCFASAFDAWAYLAGLMSIGDIPQSLPIVDVHAEDGPGLEEGPNISIFVSICIIVGVLIAALCVIKRKRLRANGTWFPSNFVRKSSTKSDVQKQTRECPIGNESPPSTICSSIDHGEEAVNVDYASPLKRQRLSHPSPSNSLYPNTTLEMDQSWMTQTSSAHPHPAMALTPPRESEATSIISNKGPDGLTPLMLAVMRSTAMTTDQEDEGNAHFIEDLLSRGADVNDRTKTRGETALHLAARYNLPVAARKLLEFPVNTNAEDNSGETPLHVAVRADAIEVFRLLIQNRSTSIDAKTQAGFTPMIIAVRLVVENMVEELERANADIGAVDNDGRSALHWAAALNNLPALEFLLSKGSNKDLQDNQEQTPLLLAAKEGHEESVRTLLKHGANREVTDHLDMSPRDIANRMCYHDVVHLLDTYSMLSNALTPNSHVTSPLDMNGEMVTNGYGNGAKPKKKGRANKSHANGDVNGRDHGKEKKRKNKKRPNSDESLPPPVLSPPESVGSPNGYTRTPPPGGVYSLPVTTQNMIDPRDHYQLKEMHAQGPHVVDMQRNGMVNGRAYSQINNLSPETGCMGGEVSMDIARATVGVPMTSSTCWQQGSNTQRNCMAMHRPDTQVLVQGSNSQPNIPTIMRQAPSTQSLQTMSPEACESTSPQPCTMEPSPSLANHYASSPNHPNTTTQQATQYAMTKMNSIYASPHRGKVPQQMHPMLANNNHHSQNGMYPHTPISELPNGYPNSPENCMQEFSRRENGLPNHAKQNMRMVNGKVPGTQHRDMMMEKYPTPPSQHSQNGGPLDPSTYLLAYPTPSPESPGKWSSSSPISAQSDWSGSEGICSPPAPTGLNQMNGQNGTDITNGHDLVNGHALSMSMTIPGGHGTTSFI